MSSTPEAFTPILDPVQAISPALLAKLTWLSLREILTNERKQKIASSLTSAATEQSIAYHALKVSAQWVINSLSLSRSQF
jgi:hypothetical protein